MPCSSSRGSPAPTRCSAITGHLPTLAALGYPNVTVLIGDVRGPTRVTRCLDGCRDTGGPGTSSFRPPWTHGDHRCPVWIRLPEVTSLRNVRFIALRDHDR